MQKQNLKKKNQVQVKSWLIDHKKGAKGRNVKKTVNEHRNTVR